jgi:para-aminobenzoate synthetase component 1
MNVQIPGQNRHPAPDAGLDWLADQPADRRVALLHSGRPDPRWARRCWAGLPRLWFRHRPGQSELVDCDGRPLPSPVPWTGRLFDDLHALLQCQALPAPPGAWVGYISYEIARLIEPAKLGHMKQHPWPIVELGYCDRLDALPVHAPGAASRSTPSDAPISASAALDENADRRAAPPKSDFTPAAYHAAVQRVLDYIAAGDIFQVNLAQRFVQQYHGDWRQLFSHLAAISPAWYGAYLELPPLSELALGERALLSTSPELFLELGDQKVITRPIKGTRPARAQNTTDGPIDDDPSRIELLHSEKDKAELAMIVDLLRNDLGRVCAYGSVRVAEPRTIETHPTIHHATATICGRLHQSRRLVDLLRATLPGGSITGAPKVRAMQIIDELEPVARGPYCGCIGYLQRDAMSLNIAIRTITAQGHRAADAPSELTFHVGGGIVADSTPADEYDETLAKARAMIRALGAATC